MNALWITRMAAYKHTPELLATGKCLVRLKIERKNVLLTKYKRPTASVDVEVAKSTQELLLLEARAGKQFWREFRTLLPLYACAGRKPGATDVVNRLLDIGYHHLTVLIRKLLEKHFISPALGILHVARTATSAPLAYDLVELFRADIVDREVLSFLRLKKKPLVLLAQRDIAHFLHNINKRLEHKYYFRDFRMCHTYRYYMEVQILKFIKAINNRQVFQPLSLPTRHDTRCRLTTSEDVIPFDSGVPHKG